MLKVAIIGCGKIADAHAAQIQRIKDCEIIAVCDREELMGKQLFERFRVKDYFNNVDDLLEKSNPDVVHVTTPPQSHFHIARRCLLHGAHVYVEKPFTLNAGEAVDLIALAERKGLRITAGHDGQFSHVARRMRQMVREGFLGGAPAHMESYYGYELGATSSYAKALLGDKRHWVRSLPGQLLQNIISHGIARIAEYLTTDTPQVIAHGFVSPALSRLGETEIVDELRVIISESSQTTAYFTFSSQMRPCLHQFRIYGPRNGLLLDQDNETLIRLSGRRRKSYLEHFVSPVSLAKQYLGNTTGNLRRFLANDFHMQSGMKVLIEGLYESIRGNAPLPIPYAEILRTARIMDAIFAQTSLRPGEPSQNRADQHEIGRMDARMTLPSTP
jgi:predicted dehydrogenase